MRRMVTVPCFDASSSILSSSLASALSPSISIASLLGAGPAGYNAIRCARPYQNLIMRLGCLEILPRQQGTTEHCRYKGCGDRGDLELRLWPVGTLSHAAFSRSSTLRHSEKSSSRPSKSSAIASRSSACCGRCILRLRATSAPLPNGIMYGRTFDKHLVA